MADKNWFRVYNDHRHNRKVKRLSDSVFRTWIGLLALASQEGGALPAIEDVATEMDISVGKARDIVQILLSAELLDRDGDGTITPHNWNGRQYKSDSSTTRVKQFRKRRGNVTSDVTETPPETETETESETESEAEKKAERAKRAPLRTKLPPDWPSIQDREGAVAYWRKAGREDLVAALENEVLKARAHHQGHGTRAEDWSQSWVTWYARAVEYTKPPRAPAQSGLPKAKIFTLAELDEKPDVSH